MSIRRQDEHDSIAEAARANRKKLRYIITPEGIALRASLTMDYIEQQFLLYRKTRNKVKEYIQRARTAGYNRISLHGEGDVADICRLTCLEQGMEISQQADLPAITVTGLTVRLDGIKEEE